MARPVGIGSPSSSVPPSPEGIGQTNQPENVSQSAKTETTAAQTPQDSSSSSSNASQSKTRLAENKLGGLSQQALLSSKFEKQTNLKKGMEGESVSKLQDFLISKGFMGADQKATGPGKFGPQTEEALKAYQRSHGLKDDGILGPKTRKSMEGSGNQATTQSTEKKTTTQNIQSNLPKAKLDGAKEVPDSQLNGSRSLQDQAKLYDKYSKLVPEGKLNGGTNEMNIVGLRHHDISSNKDLKSYDDRFMVLYKDEDGNKRVKVFEGATHTGQKYVKDTQQEDGSYKAKFTDVNGDGRSDIAYIKPGTYEFHTGKNAKYGDHLRPDQDIAAWRDTNQDGKISANERNTNYTAGAILFHKGGTSAPQSVGCQTMAPHEFDPFMDLMKKDPNGKITYTLADVQ